MVFPNKSNELIGSKLLHRDDEDYKQFKVFIPIEEVNEENGPLHLLNKKKVNHYMKVFLIKK